MRRGSRKRFILLLIGALIALGAGIAAIEVVSGGSGRDVVPPGRIAYNNARGDLFVVNSDGTQRRRLTRSGKGTDYDPTWSPDGKRIVFRTTRGVSYSGDRDPSNLFLINSDGSGERQLTLPHPDRYATGGLFPAWSPNADLIAFSNGHGINLMRPDGVVTKTLGIQGECSVWSPDGRRIMYCSNAVLRGQSVDNWDVFVMNADGTGVRQLTRAPGRDYPGAWSPDGKEIVFSSDRNGNFDIYSMHADGSHLRRITHDPGGEAVDAWLPDGRLVVALSKPDVEGPPRWILMNAHGGERVDLPQLAQAMDPIAWLLPG